MGILSSLFHKKNRFDHAEEPLEQGPEIGPWSGLQNNSEEDFNPARLQSTRAAEMAQYEASDFNQAPRDLVSGERFRGGISDKDVQLILSKLDLISSRLDNLNRRLETFEMGRKKDIW